MTRYPAPEGCRGGHCYDTDGNIIRFPKNKSGGYIPQETVEVTFNGNGNHKSNMFVMPKQGAVVLETVDEVLWGFSRQTLKKTKSIQATTTRNFTVFYRILDKTRPFIVTDNHFNIYHIYAPPTYYKEELRMTELHLLSHLIQIMKIVKTIRYVLMEIALMQIVIIGVIIGLVIIL